MLLQVAGQRMENLSYPSEQFKFFSSLVFMLADACLYNHIAKCEALCIPNIR